tara:strand:+ start:12 stop:203 length:192 start_codon:yes stop_codon:yes gene_type:complete
MSTETELLQKWQEIKVLMESLEVDIAKNANGNASAGVRVRRGLRNLKSDASALVKISLEKDKK